MISKITWKTSNTIIQIFKDNRYKKSEKAKKESWNKKRKMIK